jgi:hypothetical protein
MRRSPEVLVKRLRNRKFRIIGYSVLIIVGLCLIAWHWFVLTTLTSDLVPKEGDDLLWHAVLSQQLLPGIACLEAVLLLLGVGIGAVIALLIGEVTAFTKNDLLVNLWDRVEALEQSQRASSQSLIPNP